MSEDRNDDRALGRIEATVTQTHEEAKAIRTELGVLAKEHYALSARVGEIESAREIQVPQFNSLRHDFANHRQTDAAWKSKQEGLAEGQKRSLKAVWIVGTFFASIVAMVLVAIYVQSRTDARHIETLQQQAETRREAGR